MSLLITAGQVLAGPAGERIPDGAVLVADGTVTAVGKRDEVERLAPQGTETRAFPEATVLPGLIDCHVHLAFDAGPDPVAGVQQVGDAELFSGMADRARLLLGSGVTTVRDLGDRGGLAARLRDAIVGGTLQGPRILTATAPITPPGGHCWFLGGETEGEAAIRERVRRNAAEGADLIKIMATGGGLTKGGAPAWQSQYTVADLWAAVDEAHGLGLRVAAHAHGTAGIVDAVAAGVDTLEHCTWLTDGGLDARPEAAADIAAKGIFVCPAASPNWRSLGRFFGQQMADAMFDQIRWLDEQGVRLAAGTDAGVPHAVFDGIVSSLELFEHLGFTNDRIIEIATVNAADALGIAGTVGRLSPGYRADLLVVDGDPLDSLAALRDIQLVVADGRPSAGVSG